MSSLKAHIIEFPSQPTEPHLYPGVGTDDFGVYAGGGAIVYELKKTHSSADVMHDIVRRNLLQFGTGKEEFRDTPDVVRGKIDIAAHNSSRALEQLLFIAEERGMINKKTNDKAAILDELLPQTLEVPFPQPSDSRSPKSSVTRIAMEKPGWSGKIRLGVDPRKTAEIESTLSSLGEIKIKHVSDAGDEVTLEVIPGHLRSQAMSAVLKALDGHLTWGDKRLATNTFNGHHDMKQDAYRS